jgi:hypothetical protein
MDQSDEEKMKEWARLRARAKAQKKRKEEKELKRYKETNAYYQKKINETRTEYGLKKKKVQKTMGSFFTPPPT